MSRARERTVSLIEDDSQSGDEAEYDAAQPEDKTESNGSQKHVATWKYGVVSSAVQQASQYASHRMTNATGTNRET